ncbi:MAG: NAD(P)H-hydrate dehydratase [Flavihumibacter sp.]
MFALSARQVRAWDQYTLQQENSPSIDLMERAANACTNWLLQQPLTPEQPFYIFCGNGNNGGDGLAIARLLIENGRRAEVFILEFGKPGTDDFQTNLQRLHALHIPVQYLENDAPLPALPPGCWLIDALLGTGTNRPPTGRLAELIQHINQQDNPVCSIDLPSGMPAGNSAPAGSCITATVTLSFQCYKPALLFADNAAAVGKLVLLDIGLHPAYLKAISPAFEGIDRSLATAIYQPRSPFAHKGTFGHALLLAGSTGKMGAALLAGTACIRSGPGLLSCWNPSGNPDILQTALPEAMCVQQPADLGIYRAVGCGPGLGKDASAARALLTVLDTCEQPLVLDADALNLLAEHPEWQAKVPPFSIVSPHPKEFDRLAGSSGCDSRRWEKAIEMASSKKWIVILKGHYTLVATPGGRSYFNTSGNASMAKGGSGDVLTGMLTGLLAHGYAPEQTALLAVYLHGRAGELASVIHGTESVMASDIVAQIGAAFKEIGA